MISIISYKHYLLFIFYRCSDIIMKKKKDNIITLAHCLLSFIRKQCFNKTLLPFENFLDKLESCGVNNKVI